MQRKTFTDYTEEAKAQAEVNALGGKKRNISKELLQSLQVKHLALHLHIYSKSALLLTNIFQRVGRLPTHLCDITSPGHVYAKGLSHPAWKHIIGVFRLTSPRSSLRETPTGELLKNSHL